MQATTGSSEAIYRGGLALTRRLQEKRDEKARGKSKPKIVIGANTQVALGKVASYFEVEVRSCQSAKRAITASIANRSRRTLTRPQSASSSSLEARTLDITSQSRRFRRFWMSTKRRMATDIPVHAGAASGGFLAPLLMPRQASSGIFGTPEWSLSSFNAGTTSI
ncbi:glutamate decarboxylase gad1 [Knufia fluminis]|uniref:Glutamate decarboxylase gad1 n=1 Tax=Knufia fluminis TaxID=191047 RepID=A0AAN8I632_9EURO|nr:glutamate decarboxylase gad1 [Knufia fluminis]